MTESMVEWGQRHALSFDHNLRRWVLVPVTGAADDKTIALWARETAKAWANDLDRVQDSRWLEAMIAILEAAAGQSYREPPDAVFLHLLAPPLQPPSPALATLLTYPADEPLEDFAAKLADQYRTQPVAREPVLEPASLTSDAPAWLVSAYLYADGAETLQIRQHLLWQIHEYLHVALTMAGDDIARVVQATDDLLELAAAVRIVDRPE
jgi:hypothetical protein